MPPCLPSLADFICASPLLASCGLSRDEVEAELGEWSRLGGLVLKSLGLPAVEDADIAQK